MVKKLDTKTGAIFLGTSLVLIFYKQIGYALRLFVDYGPYAILGLFILSVLSHMKPRN